MVAFSPEVLEAFLAERDDTAVVMLNLIQFKPNGGRAKYLEYLELAKPIIARFGAKILFGGDGLTVLTTGQERGWDAVLLVQYPRRTAFKDLVGDPEYQEAFKVGVQAVADIVLQPLKSSDQLM